MHGHLNVKFEIYVVFTLNWKLQFSIQLSVRPVFQTTLFTRWYYEIAGVIFIRYDKTVNLSIT